MMKTKILIESKIDKILNILPIIKKNTFLNNSEQIEYFEKENYQKKFSKIARQLVNNKQSFLIVFSNEDFLPYLYFSKLPNICACAPSNIEQAALARKHNDARVLIINRNNIKEKDIDSIINIFLSTKFEAGRHSLRLEIMNKSFAKGSKIYSFNKINNKSIVITSDHAGYNLKLVLKKYLQRKKYEVIDLGTSSTNPTAYSLYGIALGLNANKVSYGIGICGSGVGITNTINKFKGLNACLCKNTKDVIIAKQKYASNVLTLGARFIKEAEAKKIVNKFLLTKSSTNNFDFNDLAFNFSFTKFKKIKIDVNNEIPSCLKK